jgi:hypothetical protein
MTTHQLPLRSKELPMVIKLKQDFSCNGTLTGYECAGAPYTGRLPERFVSEIEAASMSHDFYVVMSYATPIAWFANGEWTVPDVKYSVTTSRHQSTVRKAIA